MTRNSIPLSKLRLLSPSPQHHQHHGKSSPKIITVSHIVESVQPVTSLFALVRSSSLSSNSSTSTRSSLTKSSSSSTNLVQPTTMPSQRTSKRSLSPSTMMISLERSPQKRRRGRKSKQQLLSLAASVKIASDDDDPDDEDIEQENDRSEERRVGKEC